MWWNWGWLESWRKYKKNQNKGCNLKKTEIIHIPTQILIENSRIEVIPNTSETWKGIKLWSVKRLDEIPKKIVTGDTNVRRIHIDNLNHVQDYEEEKDKEYQINLVRVVHEKEIFFNDEGINHNLMNLPSLFEARIQ